MWPLACLILYVMASKGGKRKKGTLDDVITTPKRPRTGESCSPTVVTEWSPKYVYQTFLRKFPEVAKLFQGIIQLWCYYGYYSFTCS